MIMYGILKRYLSQNGAVVCAVLDGTEMCRAMEQIHKTSAVCSAALGRLSMGASLLGYALKNPGEPTLCAERDRRCADLYALFADDDAHLAPGAARAARINLAKK